MIMEGSSILGMIISGLWLVLLITLPILVIIVVARVIRRMVTPHDKEMQQLLEKAVTLLEENNRLLNQQIAGKHSEENQATHPPAGAAG
jgi:membrane protein implicated in regulation of membrane protease activity